MQWKIQGKWMRVMIKEAYPIIRKGLTRLMNDYGAREVTCYTDIAAVKEALSQSDQVVELLIFGMHSDEVGGMEPLLKMARKHFKQDVRMLVLSELPEVVFAPLSIAAGAKGFVSTRERVDVIVAAVKALSLGGTYVSRQMAQHPLIQQVVHTGELNVFSLLSYREREVAEYLVKDIPLREISSKLNLNYTTVATYRSRIMKKVNVKRLADFRRLAVGSGCLS